ncbi:MAG: DUF2723 domain-containing protein, partial [Anaerolineales bacterium]|nr:DUF2723 domain-containing protein [Anaerolineales bacterium]
MSIGHSQTIANRLPPFILVLSLLIIYLSTLAPGLTWANGRSDGGDLITAAHTGGIAHPTGYPLYLILARLFQNFPIGSLAYRTNLLSMTAAICSAVVVYRLVEQNSPSSNDKYAWLAGLTAGFAFGLSPLVWSQAVITEVYTLQAFLTVSILYLSTNPLQNINPKVLERVRGLVFGLAMGNHVTTILLSPLILFSKNIEGRTISSIPSIIRQLVWIILGLSLYLILPLRAVAAPPVNWGNPITLDRFWWLVSGELYQYYYLQFQPTAIWERVQVWASL